jgi:hypothetical protein
MAIVAHVSSPNASTLAANDVLAANVLEIFPLCLGAACPTKEAWYIRPYLGVSCLVFNALNNAFSAPNICTVDEGCFARFNNDPMKSTSQMMLR